MRIRIACLATAIIACVAMAFPAWAGNGQNLLQYVPQDTGVVVSVDLEQLRTTALFDLIWGMATSDPEVTEELAELQATIGFDPTTDLSTFMFAMNAEDEERFLILVEGTFDSTNIATYIQAQGEEVATMEYQGFTVYYEPALDPAAALDDNMHMAFISDTVVALGTQAQLNAALDSVAAGGANFTANTAMNDLAAATDSSGSFWFAGTMNAAMSADVAGSPMASMASFRGGGTLSDSVSLSYILGTEAEADATALSTFLTEELNSARSQPELAQLGLTSVLDTITIGSSGSDVSIDVAVPAQTVTQIVTIFQALMQAEGGF